MSKQFYFKQLSLAWVRSLNIKTVSFQVIQFIISTYFSSIWSIDRALSGATTPGQNGPGSDENEAKAILVEEQQWYNPIHSWGFNEFMPFPRVIVKTWT